MFVDDEASSNSDPSRTVVVSVVVALVVVAAIIVLVVVVLKRRRRYHRLVKTGNFLVNSERWRVTNFFLIIVLFYFQCFVNFGHTGSLH